MKKQTWKAAVSAAAICMAAVFSPSIAADVAALTVSVNGDDVSVSIPTGVLEDSSALYLVWDLADRGSNLESWPVENRIAYSGTPAVSSAAATYTLSKATVPAKAFMRVIATSNVRLIDGWVKLGAYQYLNTGVSATLVHGLGIKYRYVGSQTGGDYGSLMGGVLDNDFTIGRYVYNANCLYFRWRGTAVTTAFQGLATSTDIHEITVNNRVASLDGTPQISNLAAGAMGTIGRPVILGATWKNTSPFTALSGRYLHAEWHYACLYDSAHVALVNLVPALRGDAASSEAVFYDTVSGACFANAGTGTLDYSGDVTNTVASTVAMTDAIFQGRVATWTGGGNALDATDPLNWNVLDSGVPVAGAIPTNGTRIEGCTLAANADWSAIAWPGTWIQQVEYVDAANGVYVDTGFCPNQNTRVVMDVMVQGGGAYEYWFGVFKAYNVEAFAVGNAGSNVYSGFGNIGGGYGKPVASGRHTIDYDKGVLKVDGTTHTTMSGQTFQLDKSIYLFMQNRQGTPYAEAGLQKVIRFHSCQIYDDGNLVRDYVPVVVGGAVKLYDRKNEALVEFQKKAGTETVVAVEPTGVRFGGDAVEIVGTINLAGHSLTVGDLAGTGTVTDSVGGGELHVPVGSGFVLKNEGLTLSGGLKLVKEGSGLLVGAKAGQTYTGGTLVSSGRLRRGVNNQPFGAQGALITVEDGAAFDWAGGWVNGAVSTAYNFSIAGSGPDGEGAIVSSVSCGTWNVGAIANLELTDDALIGGYGGWGFNYVGNTAAQKHTVTMNGHTLNIKIRGTGTSQNNTGVFHFRNVTTVGSGTIAIIDCGKTSAWVYPSFFTYGCDLSSVTFDLGEGYCTYVGVVVKVGTFIDRRSYGSQAFDTNADSGSNAFTVLECFKPMATNLVRSVTLGDATHLSPVLDLSELNGPFVLPSGTYSLGAASGATVCVNVGERKTSGKIPLVAWETPPTGVSFAWPDGVSGKGRLVVKEDGLYVIKGLTIIVR
jgi:hypothetical protein